jgi:hypothetical protein
MAFYDVVPGLNAITWALRNSPDNMNTSGELAPPAAQPPAVTQNAVNAAVSMKADAASQLPGGLRGTERGVAAAGAPSIAGLPAGSDSGVSTTGLPYTMQPTVSSGVTRIDARGQSPLFTNMGAAGLDDLQRKGSPLPSVPGFLSRVRNFGEGAVAAPTSAPAYGGGMGMIHPHMFNMIDNYEREAQPLLASPGIVDRLRGRTMLRNRARLIGDMTSVMAANSGAEHAAASTSLALSGAQRVQREGEQNVASNLLRAHEIATQARGHELAALPHLEDIVRGQRYAQEAKAGNAEAMRSIAHESRFPPLPRIAPLVPDMSQPGSVFTRDALGNPVHITAEDFKAQDPTSAARRNSRLDQVQGH